MQGSLVRQLPFASRAAWLEFVPASTVPLHTSIAQRICGTMLLWLLAETLYWVARELYLGDGDGTGEDGLGGEASGLNASGLGLGWAGESALASDGALPPLPPFAPPAPPYAPPPPVADVYRRRPLHLFMCDARLGTVALVLHALFASAAALGALCVLLLAVRNNVFWLGVVYGYL